MGSWKLSGSLFGWSQLKFPFDAALGSFPSHPPRVNLPLPHSQQRSHNSVDGTIRSTCIGSSSGIALRTPSETPTILHRSSTSGESNQPRHTSTLTDHHRVAQPCHAPARIACPFAGHLRARRDGRCKGPSRPEGHAYGRLLLYVR